LLRSNSHQAIKALFLIVAANICFCNDALIPASQGNYPIRRGINSFRWKQLDRQRRAAVRMQSNKWETDYQGTTASWMGSDTNCEDCNYGGLMYGDSCSPNGALCNSPFVCNSKGFCDCQEGYSMVGFTCYKDCPLDYVVVNATCYKEKYLNEECEVEGQCIDSYARCIDGKCQCSPGVKQINGKCTATPQCPIGSPAMDDLGKTIECDLRTGSCPDRYSCYAAHYSESKGICCRFDEMNCPVGEAVKGRNCSNCNGETHYCLAYIFGVITKELCCPTPCPPSSPILVNNRCYPNVAYGSPCISDHQCNHSVYNSECKKDNDGIKKCLCRSGRYSYQQSLCIREANLDEPCETRDDCRIGTNTICLNGTCQCYPGYFPEPQSDVKKATRCIGEPTCPTKYGAKRMLTYDDCSFDNSKCSAEEYCRTWWSEATRNFSLCCRTPAKEDFEALCNQFNMVLQYSDPKEAEPLTCKINEFPPYANLISRGSRSRSCPAGMHCIFSPYTNKPNTGVCCKLKNLQQTKPMRPSKGDTTQPPSYMVGLDGFAAPFP
ncbi:EB module, partial [Trichuris suis]